MSYEEKILAAQDTEYDECSTCEYKGNCKNQCMEIKTIYNPVIATYVKKEN